MKKPISIYNIIYIAFVTIGLILLAVHYPVVVIPIFSLIAVVILTSWITGKKKSQQYKEAFDSVFEGAERVPKYEQSWSYGYPYFQLTFQEKADRDQYIAGDRSAMFSRKIEDLCRTESSKKRPFNVKQAIFLTYEAELASWKKEGREYQKRRK